MPGPILSAAAAGRKRTAGRWGEGTSPILKQEHRKASKRSDFAWLAEEPRTLRAIEIAERCGCADSQKQANGAEVEATAEGFRYPPLIESPAGV